MAAMQAVLPLLRCLHISRVMTDSADVLDDVLIFMQVVVTLILCGIIAGLATAVSAALILPSVAGDELRLSLGQALLGIGRSLSGYAGRIFAPDDHEMAVQHAASRRLLHATLQQYSGLEPTEEVQLSASRRIMGMIVCICS